MLVAALHEEPLGNVENLLDLSLIHISEDVTKMETMFNLLLGNDEAGRKRHISEHGKEYLDQLDLQ